MTSVAPPQKIQWDEADSQDFLEHGRFFIPDREEQIDTLCSLLPLPTPADATDATDTARHIVELCCGDGTLSAALLDRFPGATVHAYDGSPAMLAAAATHLASHGERFDARLFDLADAAWRHFPWPVDAIVSSLAIHHLDGAAKARLYADLHQALAPGGALLIADLVEPTHARGKALAARRWDEAVAARSLALAKNLEPLAVFREDGWNFYADPHPDPADQPSPLFDQLRWLAAAGFVEVDVYWMRAGHAIFGGTKAPDAARGPALETPPER